MRASGRAGLRTFAPLIAWLGIGLSPVLRTVAVLHRFTPALAVALRQIGLVGRVAPVGTWVRSALVWSICSSASSPGVAAAGVSAWLAPTSRTGAVAVTVPAHGARTFLGLPPVAVGPWSVDISRVAPALTSIAAAGTPALLWFGCVRPCVGPAQKPTPVINYKLATNIKLELNRDLKKVVKLCKNKI